MVGRVVTLTPTKPLMCLGERCPGRVLLPAVGCDERPGLLRQKRDDFGVMTQSQGILADVCRIRADRRTDIASDSDEKLKTRVAVAHLTFLNQLATCPLANLFTN